MARDLLGVLFHARAHRPATTPVKAALFALILFNTSYMAEVIRAGIQSIPKGQVEAARTVGLTHLQAMRYVVLPQALRHMSPALVSRFIAQDSPPSSVMTALIGVAPMSRTSAASAVGPCISRINDPSIAAASALWLVRSSTP